MIETPWGDSGALKERRLRPGPGVPRADVERNQRERLYGAMVAVASDSGYAKTRVSDVIEVAGVSRATFYGYFENKEECLLATIDEIVGAALAASEGALDGSGTPHERARRAVDSLAAIVVAQPAAARLCLVESYAAGPAAVGRVDRAMSRFEELIDASFEPLAGGGRMPAELVAAFTGSVRKIVHTHLHRRTEDELVELLPEVLEFLASYRPPPAPIDRAAPQRSPGATSREASAADPETEAGPVERIERATLAAVAEQGLAEAGIARIASRARVSLSTFYEHFDGKAEALESALESARTRLWAAAEPAFQRSRGWAQAVLAGLEAMLAFFEREPDYARVITADVYAAGAPELERLERSLERGSLFVEGGFEIAPAVAPVAREAIPSALYSLLCRRIASSGTEGLTGIAPAAAYLVLAPFLGPEQACEAALGSLEPRG